MWFPLCCIHKLKTLTRLTAGDRYVQVVEPIVETKEFLAKKRNLGKFEDEASYTTAYLRRYVGMIIYVRDFDFKKGVKMTGILVKIISIQTNLSFEESLGFDKLDNQGGHYARLVVWTFFGN